MVDGEKVYLLGGRSGKKKGKVISLDYQVSNWQGQRAKEYRYMIQTDIQLERGDSGGLLVKKLENGYYALSGFLKGRKSDHKSFYTSWRSVESRLRWVGRNGKVYDIKVWQHP